MTEECKGYKSQWFQDRFLDEQVFFGKRDGVFVDVGAHDGISGSNTYFFEKFKNWSGICVEPIQARYEELTKNRSCICLNCCVYNRSGIVSFIENTGFTEMLSGIKDTFDQRHLKRIAVELAQDGGTSVVIEKKCLTLTEILEENKITHIDYLSVDTEGSEYEVLMGVDFSKISVDVITVENNYPDSFGKVDELLVRNGFKHIFTLTGDEVYVKFRPTE